VRHYLVLLLITSIFVACGSDKEQATTDAPPATSNIPTTDVAETPVVAEETPTTTAVAVVAPRTPMSRSPERIQFIKGSYSGTVNGSVSGSSVIDYVLRARADQMMTVTLSASGSSAFFIVVDDGDAMSEAVTDWNGELPYTGDYHIRVFLSGEDAVAEARASYALLIEIR